MRWHLLYKVPMKPCKWPRFWAISPRLRHPDGAFLACDLKYRSPDPSINRQQRSEHGCIRTQPGSGFPELAARIFGVQFSPGIPCFSNAYSPSLSGIFCRLVIRYQRFQTDIAMIIASMTGHGLRTRLLGCPDSPSRRTAPADDTPPAP